jgi:hypothetical protein
MTAKITCPIPSSINPLSPNGFMFSIQKLPEVSFFCQQVNLPDLTLGTPEVATPFSTMVMAGDILTFGTLNIQFLVDDQMTNYKVIHNWLIGLGFPESYDQYINFQTEDSRPMISELSKNFSDATLSVLGPNNLAVQTINFIDVVPVSLDSMMFQSTSDDVQYIAGNATFRYNYYKFL